MVDIHDARRCGVVSCKEKQSDLVDDVLGKTYFDFVLPEEVAVLIFCDTGFDC